MENSINLVSLKSGQLEKEQNRLRIARVAAFIVMFMVAAVAVLVFIINLTLPIDTIKQNEKVALSNISALHKKLVQHYLVEDRVNNLVNVISKRGQLPRVIDTLLALVPGDLSVGSLQIDAKQVSLIVSGESLLSMNKLIDEVTVLNNQNRIIKNVVVQQLSLDVKGNRYSVSIQADIK